MGSTYEMGKKVGIVKVDKFGPPYEIAGIPRDKLGELSKYDDPISAWRFEKKFDRGKYGLFVTDDEKACLTA